MKGYLCESCGSKMKELVSFCPSCKQPTPAASVEEMRAWDIAQWRRHQEGTPASAPAGFQSVRTASYAPSAPPAPVVAQQASEPARSNGNGRIDAAGPPLEQGSSPSTAEKPRRSFHALGRSILGGREDARREKQRSVLEEARRRLAQRREADVRLRSVIDAPQDYQFVYEACTSCDKIDWILRTGRNEDESYRYWCVRCSRSFKTDLRLPHGSKPFLVGGAILGALVALSNLL